MRSVGASRMRVIRRATRPADGIVTREVFQCVDLILYLVHAPLQNLNASFGNNACIAFIEIYATVAFLRVLSRVDFRRLAA